MTTLAPTVQLSPAGQTIVDDSRTPYRVQLKVYLNDQVVLPSATSTGSWKSLAAHSYAFKFDTACTFDRVELITMEGEALATVSWLSPINAASFLDVDLPLPEVLEPNSRKLVTPAALHVKDEVALQLRTAFKPYAIDLEAAKASIEAKAQELLGSLASLSAISKQVEVLDEQLNVLHREVKALQEARNQAQKPSKEQR